MHELALMAATEWAQANAPGLREPVEFGHKVALTYLACRDTEYHAGDEKAMAAALAALSIPSEVLQLLSQLSLLLPRSIVADASQMPMGGAE